MTDAADRLAQALRDLVDEAVQGAAAKQSPTSPSPQTLDTDPGRTWLSREQVAERLKIPVRTLAAWASRGRGPKYYKFGRWARYQLSDVMDWEEQQLA
jgi:excisionase family DNA binding protein